MQNQAQRTILPRRQGAQARKRITVDVYPIAGRQLFFRVPDWVCRECNLAVRAVQQVVEGLGNPKEVRVRIRPWLNYLPMALMCGGWHPPVVVINGKRFSQGIVPDIGKLREKLQQSLGETQLGT